MLFMYTLYVMCQAGDKFLRRPALPMKREILEHKKPQMWVYDFISCESNSRNSRLGLLSQSVSQTNDTLFNVNVNDVIMM